MAHLVAGSVPAFWTPATPRALRIRALRTILAMTAYAAALSSPAGVSIEGGTARIPGDPSVFFDPDHQRLAQALLRTPEVLSGGKVLGASFRTMDDGAPEPIPADAGLAQAVQIAIVLAAAGALTWCAHEAAGLVDGQLAREQDTQRLLSTQAVAVAMAEAHGEAEKAAGKPLPLTEAEKRVLDQLGGVQTEIAKKQPGTAFNLNLGDFLPVALVAGAAWLFFR
jgi:hypothetical protein